MNKALFIVNFAIGFFVLLVTVAPLRDLLVVLNGAFVGCLAAIVVAYWRLFLSSIIGIHPYDRVRQMTIGFFLCWVAVAALVGESVFISDRPTNETELLFEITSRYVAIWAAGLQVSAPDFGLGIFHGRDRKMLWLSVLFGLMVAVATVYIQETTVALFVITTVVASFVSE